MLLVNIFHFSRRGLLIGNSVTSESVNVLVNEEEPTNDTTDTCSNAIHSNLSSLKDELMDNELSNDTVGEAVKQETLDVGFWEHVAEMAISTEDDANSGQEHSNENYKELKSWPNAKRAPTKMKRKKLKRKINANVGIQTMKKKEPKRYIEKYTVLVDGVRRLYKDAPDGIYDVVRNHETSSEYYGYQRQIENGKVIRCFCKICQLAYENTEALKVHMNKHHRITKQLYVCEFCAKEFYGARSLRKHIERHKSQISGDKFRCNECAFETFIEVYLRNHKNRHHPDPSKTRMLYCDQCNYKNSLQKNLTRHIWDKHKQPRKPKEHICTWEGCNKSFSRPAHLKAHMCIHTGEKPFTCKHCEYSAIQQNSLMVHMKSCHPDIPYDYTYRKSLAESKKAQLDNSL